MNRGCDCWVIVCVISSDSGIVSSVISVSRFEIDIIMVSIVIMVRIDVISWLIVIDSDDWRLLMLLVIWFSSLLCCCLLK